MCAVAPALAASGGESVLSHAPTDTPPDASCGVRRGGDLTGGAAPARDRAQPAPPDTSRHETNRDNANRCDANHDNANRRRGSRDDSNRRDGHPDGPEGRLPKLVPWVEVNLPRSPVARWFPEAGRTRPGATLLDFCVEALPHWAKVTDVVIVSTKPGQVRALYPELMRRKPDRLFIIGGLKTYTLPGTTSHDDTPYDFADARGWRRIADEARAIVRITGTNVVVLENETTLTPFHKGDATIDYDKLTRALGALRETGIVFWWNLPTILENSRAFPNRQAETTRLLKVIADALPDSAFMAGFTMWRDWRRNAHGEVDRRREALAILGPKRMLERLIVTPDGYWHYSGGRKKRGFTATEALAARAGIVGDTVNIYPGAAHWVDVAKQFEALLAD
ncbi:MAG: hypothetical protein ACE5E6_04635 [Phycisphaerae bacterium]